MRRTGMMNPEPPTAGVVDSIAHTPERLAEAGPLGMVVPPGERDAGLQREIVEVGGTHLLRTEPVPPQPDEGAPDTALGIGALVHVLQVAEEPGHARDSRGCRP